MTTFPMKPRSSVSQVRRCADERRKHSSYKMLGVRLLKYSLLSVVALSVFAASMRSEGNRLNQQSVWLQCCTQRRKLISCQLLNIRETTQEKTHVIYQGEAK